MLPIMFFYYLVSFYGHPANHPPPIISASIISVEPGVSMPGRFEQRLRDLGFYNHQYSGDYIRIEAVLPDRLNSSAELQLSTLFSLRPCGLSDYLAAGMLFLEKDATGAFTGYAFIPSDPSVLGRRLQTGQIVSGWPEDVYKDRDMCIGFSGVLGRHTYVRTEVFRLGPLPFKPQ